MILLHRLASVVRWIFRRNNAEAELSAELQAFVDMAVADHVRDARLPATPVGWRLSSLEGSNR